MSKFFTKNINYTLKSKLVHDLKKRIFMHEIAHVKGNFIIKIEYKKIDDIFVLHHTEVPTEHRGQDFGFFIAHEVFDYLVEHNIKAALYCPFLRKCSSRYPSEKLNKIIEKVPKFDKSVFENLEGPW